MKAYNARPLQGGESRDVLKASSVVLRTLKKVKNGVLTGFKRAV